VTLLNQPRRRIGIDDFENMLFDKPDNEKWELIDGYVCKSMVGARMSHYELIRNLDTALSNHLRETRAECRTFRETFFLRSEADDLQSLPDVMVFCGPFVPDATFITKPIVVFEVLSPASESRDLVQKKQAYRRLTSLKHYVVVARDELKVHQFDKVDLRWDDQEPMTSPSDVLRLPAIDFTMSLAQIYAGVIDQAGT